MTRAHCVTARPAQSRPFFFYCLFYSHFRQCFSLCPQPRGQMFKGTPIKGRLIRRLSGWWLMVDGPAPANSIYQTSGLVPPPIVVFLHLRYRKNGRMPFCHNTHQPPPITINGRAFFSFLKSPTDAPYLPFSLSPARTHARIDAT